MTTWERCAGCGREYAYPHLCRTHLLCGSCHPRESDVNEFEGVVSSLTERPLTTAEVKHIEQRTALVRAVTGAVTMVTLIVLLWGVGGFIVWVVRG